VGRRHRVQLVIEGARRSRNIIASSRSPLPAGDDVPAGTVAVVRSPQALRCSRLDRAKRASHIDPPTRHPAPSCGRHVLTAERTLDPARMFTQSLTPGPELENSQGQNSQ
jgi:hypothetical protein